MDYLCIKRDNMTNNRSRTIKQEQKDQEWRKRLSGDPMKYEDLINSDLYLKIKL